MRTAIHSRPSRPDLSAGAARQDEVLDGAAVAHRRTVWAVVEIRYSGSNYGTPRSVSVLRWEFR